MKTSRLALAATTTLILNSTVIAAPAIEIGGLLEVEATSGEDTSDIAVATAELGFSGQVNDKVSGEVVLLHEAGEPDPIVVDIATVTLGFSDSLSLTAGQSYAPFGVFDSHMISEPLTLELAETGATLLQADYTTGPLTASLYTFNGANASDEEIDNWGVNLAYAAESFGVTVGYIANIGDSDGIAAATIDSEVPGMSLSAGAHFGNFSMIAEYVTALQKFQPGDGNADYTLATKAQPSANNMELAYTSGDTTLALSAQRSEQADMLGLSKRRTSAAISHNYMSNTTLALEYARDEDYADVDSSMVTAQVVVWF